MQQVNENEQREKIREALYRYQKRGLPVIPCNGKMPLIKSWQNRNAPPTDAEIEEWLEKWPDMNIGLVMGAASGIVGIDVDGAMALERLEEISNGDIPETETYKTPGSDAGRRLLYRLPEGIGKAAKWIDKLEGEHSELAFLGDGQQTILPPSIHPNGKRYAWVKGRTPKDVDIAEAPEWMISRMTGKKAKESKVSEKATEKPSVNAKDVFERLKRCKKFAQALAIQGAEGLSEDDWYYWGSLLVNAGHTDAAMDFSRLSSKHNERSEERIQELIDKAGANGGPMTRCSTFGCISENVQCCFGKANENEEGDITNSPGAFIKDMEKPLPPTDPAYAPYVAALTDSPEYAIDERGNLLAFDRKGNPNKIANFVARPTKEVIRDDGVSQERTFRIEGLLSGGKKFASVDVSAAEFKRMGWVAETWGIGPSIKPGFGAQDLCRDAIQNMGVEVEEHFIYTHMGWRKLPDGRWCFLHPGGSIGAENIAVELERALEKYRLDKAVEDLRKAAQASLRLLMVAPLEVTIPLMALVYLCALCEALREAGIEPTFVLWLFGGTGTRKTSLGMLFLSHFGNFGTKSPPASFKDTANALERKAFAVKDSLLLIDDFHPEASNYESQKMAQTAQRVLRMFGDRIGRGRLTASIQFQKEFPPRGMALVTGEDLPSGESSVARFLGVELLQGAIDLKILTKAQKEAPLLSEAMRGYIEWLLPQMYNLPDMLHTEFLDKRATFQEKATHGRSGEAAAWLYISFSMMLKYMQYADACTNEIAVGLLADAEKVFAHLIGDQNALVAQERPADIFVEVLQELFVTSKVRVDKLSAGAEEDIYGASSGERIGWYDNQYLYLLPEATYNAVNRFLSGRSQKISVSSRTLWKHLDEAKLIYTEKGSDERVQRCPKRTIPTRKRGNKEKEYRPRLLHLYKSALDSEAISA